MVNEIVVEKAVFDGRRKARAELLALVARYEQTTSSVKPAPENRPVGPRAVPVSVFPKLTYDEFGKPRPAEMDYDETSHDDELPDDAADEVTQFPGLDLPLG